MKIIIDTDKKSIEVPHDFKVAYDNNVKMNKMLGRDTESILSMLEIKDFKIVATQNRSVKDTTNSKDIEKFMNNIKATDKAKYEEYKELRDKIVKHSPKGTPIKTSFLIVKKWFYENYPEQNPFKKA